MNESMNLLDLPTEVLQTILSNLSYDEIAKNRLVCRKFNGVCGRLLNLGFYTMERRHAQIMKKVKSLLPRRESVRRCHQLSRHTDILTSVETRIGMLRMTFMKYMEKNLCFFIPGKVIDEVFKILWIIENTMVLPRTHEIMQELRDISSMSIEYFEEKIAPNLKIHLAPLRVPRNIPPQNFCHAIIPPGTFVVEESIRRDYDTLKQKYNLQKQQISFMKIFIPKMNQKLRRQAAIIRNQQDIVSRQNSKILEQERSVNELKRCMRECESKIRELYAKIYHTNVETITSSTQLTPPPIYTPNIKPRRAQVLLRLNPIAQMDLQSSIVEETSSRSDRKRKLDLNDTRSSCPQKHFKRMQGLSFEEKLLKNMKLIQSSQVMDSNKSNISSKYGSLLKFPSFTSSTLGNFISRKRKLE